MCVCVRALFLAAFPPHPQYYSSPARSFLSAPPLPACLGLNYLLGGFWISLSHHVLLLLLLLRCRVAHKRFLLFIRFVYATRVVKCVLWRLSAFGFGSRECRLRRRRRRGAVVFFGWLVGNARALGSASTVRRAARSSGAAAATAAAAAARKKEPPCSPYLYAHGRPLRARQTTILQLNQTQHIQ